MRIIRILTGDTNMIIMLVRKLIVSVMGDRKKTGFTKYYKHMIYDNIFCWSHLHEKRERN